MNEWNRDFCRKTEKGGNQKSELGFDY